MFNASARRRLWSRLRIGARPRLAIEAGERGARLLLVSRDGDRVRLRRVLTADLRADGLLSPGEMAARLRALLAELPAASAMLVLPPGRTHSQLMPLREGESRAVADLAQAVGGRQFEAVPSVFDAALLPEAAGRGRALWVSIAREADVELHLLRCGVPAERVAGVLGADAALAAAFLTLPDRPPVAVLLELGATTGLLVVIEQDRPVFAADLDWGTDHLAPALAADLGCSAPEAERILARDGAEALGPATPRFSAVLQRLRQAVDLLLRDHARETGRASVDFLAAPCWVGGPAQAETRLPSLLAAVFGETRLRAWPEIAADDGSVLALASGALSYGAAVAALELGDPAPNLAPPAARATRRVELWTGALHAAGLTLAALGLVLAGLIVHGRHAAWRAREAEVASLRAASAVLPRVEEARRARDAAYLEALPGLYFQKRTRDFIAGTRSLRARRDGQDFWFALVTDAETYRAGSLPQGTPAAAPETQLLAGCLARTSGLVVELGFRPGTADPLAQVGAFIADLREAGAFASVDILPARARQTALTDRSVFAPEGADFALQLDAAAFEHDLPAVAPDPATSGARGLFQATP